MQWHTGDTLWGWENRFTSQLDFNYSFWDYHMPINISHFNMIKSKSWEAQTLCFNLFYNNVLLGCGTASWPPWWNDATKVKVFGLNYIYLHAFQYYLISIFSNDALPPLQSFHYRPHQDWQRELLRSEEGIGEVSNRILDKADEKCRKQNKCKEEKIGNVSEEKEGSVNPITENLVHTAQPLQKSENV